MKEAVKATQSVTINQASRVVQVLLEKDGHHPVFLHSSPGIGKSAMVKKIASDLGIGFVDIRLASLEPSDLCGIPFVLNGEMKFSIPSWFPTDPKSKGILFFDEISNASIAVQHAAYRIILDRSLQTGVNLPVGWSIVAAGNLKSDKTGSKDVAPALANRFATHLTIRADLDDFTSYAVKNKVNVEIIGFLNFRTDALYRFDPTKNETSFATPRSWEQASNLLSAGFSEEDLSVVLSGCVGEGTAAEFFAFKKYYAKLPSFIDIMDGKVEYTIPGGDIGVTFAIASSLIVNLASNGTNVSRVTNLQKILIQLPDDFIYLVFKSLKNVCTGDALDCIVRHTQASFSKITSYELYDKRNK